MIRAAQAGLESRVTVRGCGPPVCSHPPHPPPAHPSTPLAAAGSPPPLSSPLHPVPTTPSNSSKLLSTLPNSYLDCCSSCLLLILYPFRCTLRNIVVHSSPDPRRQVRTDALCAPLCLPASVCLLSLALYTLITLRASSPALCVPRPIPHRLPYLLLVSRCFLRRPYVRVFSEYFHPSLRRTLTSLVFIWTRPLSDVA